MKRFLRFLLLFAICACLFGVWLRWQWIMVHWLDVPNDFSILLARGQYGDSYGSLNSLFSGIALVGVVYTIYFQSKEDAQRDREKAESEKRREADERRREVESKERANRETIEEFERNFFRLVDIWTANISGMEIKSNHGEFRGRGSLTGIVRDFKVEHSIRKTPGLDAFRNAYIATYERYEDTLATYFRVLYHIFLYVDSSSVPNKEQYTSIVRALLTPSELILLSANVLGRQNFRSLTQKFHLLKHFPSTCDWAPRAELEASLQSSSFNDPG